MKATIAEIKQFKNEFVRYIYENPDNLFDVARSDACRVINTLDSMVAKLEEKEQQKKEMKKFAKARAERVANETK